MGREILHFCAPPARASSMAGIYMTYRDVPQFAPIAAFPIIPLVSPLASAFLAFAGAMFAAARLSLLIHPRIR
jgi:hypothetical protein